MKGKEVAVLCVFIGLLTVFNSINLFRRERMKRNSAIVVEHGMTRLSINMVSANELEDLPGIGPVLAARIVEYRDEKGGFKTLEELKDVKGVGGKLYARIYPYIKL